MPNRIIRDGINSSPRVNALSCGAEILYRRLMSAADDYGRFHASPTTIRGACWPLNPERISDEEIALWVAEITSGERPLVRIYEASGARYLEIQDFGQQQRSKSKFPNPSKFIETEYDINLLATCYQSDIRRFQEPKTDALTTTTTHTNTNTTSKTRAQEKNAAAEPEPEPVATFTETPEPEAPPKPRAAKAKPEPAATFFARFEEFLEPWPRLADPHAAKSAWRSAMKSEADVTAAFACRDRYLASAEVSRGIVSEPQNWIAVQSRNKWQGRWQTGAASSARPANIGTRKGAPPTRFTDGDIAAMLADDDPRIQAVGLAEKAKLNGKGIHVA